MYIIHDLLKPVSHVLREIRQEVAFLSALDHPHLTQLCGVRTSPYMCLLLELAPLGSLRTMLKEYQQSNLVLEPLTLKATVLQVTADCECVVYRATRLIRTPLN